MSITTTMSHKKAKQIFLSLEEVSKHTIKKYHNDVCTWCGKVVNEQK